MTKIKNKNLRAYEALAHDAAMQAAEHRELTPDERAISRRMLGFAQSQLAQLELEAKPRRVVRSEIAGMERVSMLQRLMNILSVQPRSAMAFRDFESMSDDDLRSALEDAEAMIERAT